VGRTVGHRSDAIGQPIDTDSSLWSTSTPSALGIVGIVGIVSVVSGGNADERTRNVRSASGDGTADVLGSNPPTVEGVWSSHRITGAIPSTATPGRRLGAASRRP